MEVRRFHTSYPARILEAMVEGLMVVRVEGDGADELPGVRRPVSAAEAAKARFVVSFPVTNQMPPYFVTRPSYDWALREGFDRTDNLPFNADYHMTWLGHKTGMTIPSGWDVVCFEAGTYTIGSGNWTYATDVVAGDELEVEYSGADRGKLKKLSAGTAVAMCREVADNGDLTFDVYH